jgi:hypothetical protein
VEGASSVHAQSTTSPYHQAERGRRDGSRSQMEQRSSSALRTRSGSLRQSHRRHRCRDSCSGHRSGDAQTGHRNRHHLGSVEGPLAPAARCAMRGKADGGRGVSNLWGIRARTETRGGAVESRGHSNADRSLAKHTRPRNWRELFLGAAQSEKSPRNSGGGRSVTPPTHARDAEGRSS